MGSRLRGQEVCNGVALHMLLEPQSRLTQPPKQEAKKV